MYSNSDPPNYWYRLLFVVFACTIAFGMLAVMLIGAQAMSVNADPVRVGLVIEGQSVEDSLWDNLSYQGLLRAEADLGVIGTVYTATTPADYGPNFQKCSLDGNQLCISTSFLTTEAISDAANLYPGVDFAIVDVEIGSAQPNLRSIAFQVDEAAYLAGTLAGLMTQSDKLGVIGGMEIPPVMMYIDGFSHGAACANADVTTEITYTNNFGDPELGAAVAQQMIQVGADVIFPPAGPTGNGAVLTATQSAVWAVGFDVDQYKTLFQNGAVAGSEYLLTSVVKNIDNAVYLTISDVVSGTFTPGKVSYGLAEEGVALAPFHEAEENIPDDYKARLAWLEQVIISGTLDWKTGCPARIFLPYTIRQE